MGTAIDAVLSGERRFHVETGDALEVLKTLPDASIDAIVTDPPAGIAFMGKEWDRDKGGRDTWIAWLALILAEARRVLKPGGHALIWSLPRTSHWTGMAVENAGFEVRDVIAHLFGSGFPKSLDVSKGVDKLAGAERESVGKHPRPCANVDASVAHGGAYQDAPDVTKPATAAAAALQGWGTALKPAREDWWLCRKPFRGSVVRNVLEHGTGAINIDAARVPHANAADLEAHAAGVAAIKERGGTMDNSWKNSSDLSGASDVTPLGRWPAHVLLTHSHGCERIGVRKIKASTPWGKNDRPPLFTGDEVSPIHYGDGDGFETVEHWRCVEGCPVAMLDGQSGPSRSPAIGSTTAGISTTRLEGSSRAHDHANGHGDEGGASRYFTTFAPEKEGTWQSRDRNQSAPIGATSRERDTSAEASADGSDCNMTLFGNGNTDRSRPAIRSTTETKTSKTTDPKTLSSSTRSPTSDCIAVASSETGNGGSLAADAEASNQLPKSIGISAERDTPPTDDAGPVISPSSADALPFVYLPKASREDREKGCEYMPKKTGGELTGRVDGSAGLNSPRAGAGRRGGRRNDHPTAKNTALMRWLCRLITPPGGIVLDCFAGSGSTGVACSAEGFRFIGIELDPNYAEIARARILGDAPLLNMGEI